MTLDKFLADIHVRMPSPFDDATLISWLNTAIRDTYKSMAIRDGYTFRGVEGRTLYPLPAGISPELISAVVADNHAYSPRRIGEAAGYRTWYKAADGFLGIYPAVSQGAPISIYYFACPPRLLTEREAEDAGISYEAQEIPFDPDFAELIKTAVFIIIAEAREDVVLANNYKLNYNMLLSRAKQSQFKKDGKYPSVQDVYRKRRHL